MQFTLFTTLTLPDRTLIAQGLAFDGDDIYVSQDGADAMILTRFVDGQPAGQMRVPGDSHGFPLIARRILGHPCITYLEGKATKTVPFLVGPPVPISVPARSPGVMPVPGLGGVVALTRKTVESGRFVYYRGAAQQFTTRPYDWIQGQVWHADLIYTMRGVPYVRGGPLYPTGPVLPPYIEVRQATTPKDQGLILPAVDIADLGRDKAGDPVDGKCEPEGMAVTVIDGHPHLAVGISTGRPGTYRLQVWTAPLH